MKAASIAARAETGAATAVHAAKVVAAVAAETAARVAKAAVVAADVVAAVEAAVAIVLRATTDHNATFNDSTGVLAVASTPFFSPHAPTSSTSAISGGTPKRSGRIVVPIPPETYTGQIGPCTSPRAYFEP